MRYFNRVVTGLNVIGLVNVLVTQRLFAERDKIEMRVPIAADGYGQLICADEIGILPDARTISLGLMQALGGTVLGGIVINKLGPGNGVALEAETDNEYLAFYHRYEAILQAGRGCRYICGDEAVPLATGEVWWVDVMANREIDNKSDDDLIAMQIDIRLEA